MQQFLENFLKTNESLTNAGLPHLLNILGAILVFLIGRWLARRSRRWFKVAIGKTNAHVNAKITNIADKLIYYGILILAFSLSLVALGVPLYSLFTILAIVIIIVAISLQTALNNVAATIIFVVFQTFKPGDWVDVLDGTFGQVKEVQVFTTVIVAQDKSVVTVPNGAVLKSSVVNYSELGYRRADMTVTISYQSDLLRAKQIMEQVLAESEFVLDEPKAVVGVEALGVRGVDFSLRPFTPADHFYATKFQVQEQIKLKLEEAGIKIPVWQQDVHIIAPENDANEPKT